MSQEHERGPRSDGTEEEVRDGPAAADRTALPDAPGETPGDGAGDGGRYYAAPGATSDGEALREAPEGHPPPGAALNDDPGPAAADTGAYSHLAAGVAANDGPDPDADAAMPAAGDAAEKMGERRIPPISPIAPDAAPALNHDPYPAAADASTGPVVAVAAADPEADAASTVVGRPGEPAGGFPAPFPGPVWGYHHHDVLSGRGATVNAHPGNRRFRALCAARKAEFDRAPNSAKRRIASEIVGEVLRWDPPGRFIERAPGGGDGGAEGVEAFFREVDVGTVLAGHSRAYFDRVGHTRERDRRLRRELGPWRDVGMEVAIQKAMSVIRDHKRTDRIALRAMGMLRRKRDTYPLEQTDGYLISSVGGMDEAAPALVSNPPAAQEDEEVSAVYEGLLPTHNDVLLGRGAFINKHLGNHQFRALALERKSRFDAAAPAARRAISLEIVALTKALVPPGRFLRRAPYALREPVPLPDGRYALPPRGLEGPWEEVPDGKACAKATQVLRDARARGATLSPPVAADTDGDAPLRRHNGAKVPAHEGTGSDAQRDILAPPVVADVDGVAPLQPNDGGGMEKANLHSVRTV